MLIQVHESLLHSQLHLTYLFLQLSVVGACSVWQAVLEVVDIGDLVLLYFDAFFDLQASLDISFLRE